MCTYDSSDDEVYFDDSSSSISYSESLFSNTPPKLKLPERSDQKASEPDNSNDNESDESDSSFVIRRRKVKRYLFTTCSLSKD